jgi:hypothetical protein
MADVGIGIIALLDLTDVAVFGTGNELVAYGLAMRLLTPSGALVECGDPSPYDSLNLRDYLGARLSDTRSLEAACNQVLGQDERADSVSATVSFSAGVIRVAVHFENAAGPFDFVLAVDQVTASLIGSF